MKKLIMLILMLFPICTGRAEEWKEVDQIPTINGSTLEIKEEKEYQWYRVKKEGGYFKNAPSNDFVKTKFFTLTEWSNWQDEYPNEKENIERKTIYHYQTMKKIKYIRLSKMSSPDLTFSSIQLYNGRNQIPYQKEEKNGEIILELKEPCYFDELEIEMNLLNVNDEENAFFIEWLYELDLPSCMETYVREWFTIFTQIHFVERKMVENQFLYEEEKVSYEKVEENRHVKVYQTELYRYQERLDYYEKEVREYYPEYRSTMVEGYPYPDLETERKRLFCKFHKKESDDVKEVIVTKEVPVEKLVLKEIPIEKAIIKESENETLLRQDNIFLKQEVENLKNKVVSLSNGKSKEIEKKEKSKQVDIKKQSLEAPLYFAIFLFGYLLGRIVTMKKKL